MKKSSVVILCCTKSKKILQGGGFVLNWKRSNHGNLTSQFLRAIPHSSSILISPSDVSSVTLCESNKLPRYTTSASVDHTIAALKKLPLGWVLQTKGQEKSDRNEGHDGAQTIFLSI